MVPCLFPSCTLHKNRIVPLPWGHPFVRAPAALDASAIFAVGHAPAQAGAHQRAPILTFVRPRRRLTFAPTAVHRGRRAQTMSRLAAVQRPPKARPLHRRARRHAAGVGSIVPVLLLFLRCLCSSDRRRRQVHRSLRGRAELAAPWPAIGFDAAMSRTRSRRGKNRAVIEARPDRDDVSPREQRILVARCSGDCRLEIGRAHV